MLDNFWNEWDNLKLMLEFALEIGITLSSVWSIRAEITIRIWSFVSASSSRDKSRNRPAIAGGRNGKKGSA